MMTVTTFWSTEINFGPIFTNRGSIRFLYTILPPFTKVTDRIVSKILTSNGSFVSEDHARVR